MNSQEMTLKQILVVDDSYVIRKAAMRILKGLQMEGSEAADGSEALVHCNSTMPDGILLDWNMPVMDGLEFLTELRRLPGGLRPKVVFCTTENNIAHIARAIQAGADEYIMKPFDRQIVQSKFEEIGLI